MKRPLSQSDTAQNINNKSVIQPKTSATEAWYSSKHQRRKRDTAQDISNRSVIQLKTSAPKTWYSSRHQQRKRDRAQDINNRSVIQLKTPATETWQNPFLSPSCAHIPLHKHKLPFFGDFPAFFVGGTLISFSQKSSLFPFMNTYSPS